MKQETGKSTAATAFGEKLPTPITYEYQFTTYESTAELVSAKDELTLDEQVKIRNTERANNARQKAYTAALDAAGIVKPTSENNDQVRLKEIFKGLMTAKAPDGSPKYTTEAARELASTVTGVAWAE